MNIGNNTRLILADCMRSTILRLEDSIRNCGRLAADKGLNAAAIEYFHARQKQDIEDVAALKAEMDRMLDGTLISIG